MSKSQSAETPPPIAFHSAIRVLTSGLMERQIRSKPRALILHPLISIFMN